MTNYRSTSKRTTKQPTVNQRVQAAKSTRKLSTKQTSKSTDRNMGWAAVQPVSVIAHDLPQPRADASVSSRTAAQRLHVTRILTWPLRQLWYRKWWLLNLIIVAVAILLVVSESARQSTVGQRFDGNTVRMQDVPHHDTALVLGAGVLPDHTPTAYLKARIETAVALYKAHRVDSLLVSGDNSSSHYDEPTVMKTYAVSLGADPSDVIIDYAGYNTYDSCYRAHAIFGVKSITVITQGYHLPRAVMTCRHLDMDTIGVSAKHTTRDWTAAYLIREHLSTAKAYAQLFLKPLPTVLGKPEASK